MAAVADVPHDFVPHTVRYKVIMSQRANTSVNLFDNMETNECNGYMIMPGVILTALHCLYQKEDHSLNVELLEAYDYTTGPLIYTIETSHPRKSSDWQFYIVGDGTWVIPYSLATSFDFAILYNRRLFGAHLDRILAGTLDANMNIGHIYDRLYGKQIKVLDHVDDIGGLVDGVFSAIVYNHSGLMNKVICTNPQISDDRRHIIFDADMAIRDGWSGGPVLYTRSAITYYVGNISSGGKQNKKNIIASTIANQDDRLKTFIHDKIRPMIDHIRAIRGLLDAKKAGVEEKQPYDPKEDAKIADALRAQQDADDVARAQQDADDVARAQQEAILDARKRQEENDAAIAQAMEDMYGGTPYNMYKINKTRYGYL